MQVTQQIDFMLRHLTQKRPPVLYSTILQQLSSITQRAEPKKRRTCLPK